MVTRVRALAFPIFQKDWLYFTLQVSSAADTDASQGAAGGIAASIFRGLQSRVENEWKAIQESTPGSFKNIVLKCVLLLFDFGSSLHSPTRVRPGVSLPSERHHLFHLFETAAGLRIGCSHRKIPPRHSSSLFQQLGRTML